MHDCFQACRLAGTIQSMHSSPNFLDLEKTVAGLFFFKYIPSLTAYSSKNEEL